MGVDHSKAFVRVTFDGIIIFCLNKRADPNRCEMGMVSLQDHQRLLTITKIKADGDEELVPPVHPLGDDDHVMIEAVEATPLGVTTFTRDLPTDPFDRTADTGDPEDFRWVLDLQGSLMHGNAASMKHDYKCKPKINIPHGIFYTHSKSAHKYFRRPMVGSINTGIQPLGKMADKVGADIVVDPIKGMVKVKIKDDEIVLKSDGLLTRYRIDITNLCRVGCGTTSDFTHYYDVVSDIDDIKFDVYELKLKGAADETKTMVQFLTELNLPIPPGFDAFGANGPPQVCNVGFMGLTNTLP